MNEAAEWLRYEPDTGHLYWVKSPNPQAIVGAKAGCPHSRGYVRVTLFGRQVFAHRLAFLLGHGRPPAKFIDHINGIRSDNRLSNLREASTRQNAHNQSIRSDSKSGLKGVQFSKRTQNWRARISIDGEVRRLGYFTTPEDAHAAYVAAAEENFGEFARSS